MTDGLRSVVGEELPPFVRDTGFPTWNRFAAVNDEFFPIHMDDKAGQAVGLPGAIGMGNLQWSYLHVLLREWLDGRGRIVSLSCEFRSPNTKGVVTARGRITAVRQVDRLTSVDLEVWTESESGAQIARGAAVVEVHATEESPGR